MRRILITTLFAMLLTSTSYGASEHFLAGAWRFDMYAKTGAVPSIPQHYGELQSFHGMVKTYYLLQILDLPKNLTAQQCSAEVAKYILKNPKKSSWPEMALIAAAFKEAWDTKPLTTD